MRKTDTKNSEAYNQGFKRANRLSKALRNSRIERSKQSFLIFKEEFLKYINL